MKNKDWKIHFVSYYQKENVKFSSKTKKLVEIAFFYVCVYELCFFVEAKLLIELKLVSIFLPYTFCTVTKQNLKRLK